MALLELLQGIFLLVGFVGMANGFPEPLNRQEEREAIRLAVAGDEDARERLVIHNLRLVAHIAKKYTKTGRDPDDVISIGTIGLIKAVSSFQPEKGVPLSSYASRCIENEILMSIRQEKRPALSPGTLFTRRRRARSASTQAIPCARNVAQATPATPQ